MPSHAHWLIGEWAARVRDGESIMDMDRGYEARNRTEKSSCQCSTQSHIDKEHTDWRPSAGVWGWSLHFLCHRNQGKEPREHVLLAVGSRSSVPCRNLVLPGKQEPAHLADGMKPVIICLYPCHLALQNINSTLLPSSHHTGPMMRTQLCFAFLTDELWVYSPQGPPLLPLWFQCWFVVSGVWSRSHMFLDCDSDV